MDDCGRRALVRQSEFTIAEILRVLELDTGTTVEGLDVRCEDITAISDPGQVKLKSVVINLRMEAGTRWVTGECGGGKQADAASGAAPKESP